MALDTNHDGAVSAAGIAAPPNPCAPSIATRTANGPPRNAPKMGSTDRCSKEMVQTLMAFDKNGDGLLTDDEVSPDWRVSSSRNACFNWTRMAMAASRRTSEPQGSAFSWNSHGSRSES